MSFISPLFLFAAGAAILPILFHFVRRMKARPVPFGSLMLLRATPKELVKRRRLRDLLLLALRVGLILLLALAFARPHIPQDRLPFVEERTDRSTVILVDLSYSMRLSGVFERAKEAALGEIDAARDADEIALVGFDDAARQLTPLGRDCSAARSVVRGLAPSYRPTDFHPALRLAADILLDARHDQSRVVLISDLQRNGFGPSMENFTLSAGIDFVPIKVAGREANAYVEAFHLSMRRTGDTTAVRFDARIRSEEGTQAQAVSLSVDRAPTQRITVPGGASVPVTFRQTASRAGFVQGALSLGADALPVDDRYHFTYEVSDRPSILAVDRGPEQRDAFFLGHAFSASEASPFTFEAGSTLSVSALHSRDVVFVANLAGPTEAETAALAAFARDGGGVIVSFGDAARPAAWSAALEAFGIGTPGDVVSARARQGSDAIIAQIDERHPIFEPFASAARGTILRPSFRHYLRIEPDSAASVLGRFDSGDPFLLERRLGRGRVLVYTSGFSTRWTDFPLDELYVPLVFQMARYADGTSETRYGFTVGDPVPLAGRPDETWDVLSPGGSVHKVTLDDAGSGFFRETGEPGHYAAASGRASFRYSVNVDTRESALDTRDEEEAYAAIRGRSDGEATAVNEASRGPEDDERNQKLWRVVLILALALFAVESLLAYRSHSR